MPSPELTPQTPSPTPWDNFTAPTFPGDTAISPAPVPEPHLTPETNPASEPNSIPETAPESPEPKAPLPDLPTTSPNRTCDFYLREIARQGSMPAVKSFLESALARNYRDFSSDPATATPSSDPNLASAQSAENPSPTADLGHFCTTYSDRLASALTPGQTAALKNYSGFGYKYINQVARGQWSYDLLGPKTPEKFASTQQSIEQISHAISSAPALETDLVTHRGTNLDTFQGYHIQSIADLATLKNQFFLETGFTSTSLDSRRSFADRQQFDDPLRRACNVTIEYLLPAVNRETIGLLSHDTSYNPEQREILIDKDSLSYVSDVEISPDRASAKLRMVLIPRQIYDPATRH